MSKCLVIFVEGDTELEFYKHVVAYARRMHPMGKFDTSIEYRNVGGVGGFKNIALRKFTKEIKKGFYILSGCFIPFVVEKDWILNYNVI